MFLIFSWKIPAEHANSKYMKTVKETSKEGMCEKQT